LTGGRLANISCCSVCFGWFQLGDGLLLVVDGSMLMLIFFSNSATPHLACWFTLCHHPFITVSPLLALTGDSQYLKLGEMYCIIPALDRYLLHSDRTPHTQMMTSFNLCGTFLYNIQHPCLHLSLLLPSDLLPSNLLLSDLLLSELTTHVPHHQLSHHPCIQDLGLIHGPYHCGEKM